MTTPLQIKASDSNHGPLLSVLIPVRQTLCKEDDNVSTPLTHIADGIDDTEVSWALPFDIILEVAAFCAGRFEFNTYLNLALSCKEVHKSLKSVLDEPVLICDDNSQLSDDFGRACFHGEVDEYLLLESEGDLLKQASIWPKIR